mmetsp:Transcript_15656/g.24305  ORF Transcript_15656/g.24305 Transcript_15656/m.24305 type:complete len:242 (-) Transcript_15656:228-953(-)
MEGLPSSCVECVKAVLRDPSLIVPPMFSLSISGMKITTGFFVSSSNSVEFASSQPNILREYSTTMAWNPRQIPKYGTVFSRQNLAAATFPLNPLVPNPPGTTTPSALFILFQAALYSFSPPESLSKSFSRCPASTQIRSNFRSTAMLACFKLLITLKYESCKPVYFPTITIFTDSLNPSNLNAIRAQSIILRLIPPSVSKSSWPLANMANTFSFATLPSQRFHMVAFSSRPFIVKSNRPSN